MIKNSFILVHDRYKEVFTFKFEDYIGGLNNSNKKW